MRKLSANEARDRVEALERIIHDTLWMARRYAHGRQSYAVGMYNDAARAALRLEIPLSWPDGSQFALDGGRDGLGGPEMSGLSEAEFAEAVAGLNAKGITPHPDRFSPAGRTALAREENDRG